MPNEPSDAFRAHYADELIRSYYKDRVEDAYGIVRGQLGIEDYQCVERVLAKKLEGDEIFLGFCEGLSIGLGSESPERLAAVAAVAAEIILREHWGTISSAN